MKLKLKPKHLQGVRPRRKKGDPKQPYDRAYGKDGRPTLYQPEFCDAIRVYFSDPEAWDLNYTDKGAGQCLPSGKLPTFERFAASIGVSMSAMLSWREKYPEFGEAFNDAKALQKAFIMEAGGVTLNAGFATFLLKCCHDMKEPESKQGAEIGEALAKLISGMPS